MNKRALALALAVLTAGCAKLPSTFRNAIDLFGSDSSGQSGGAGGGGQAGGGSGGKTPAPAASTQPAGRLLSSMSVGAGPRGIAFDSRGQLWIALHDSNSVVAVSGGKVVNSVSVANPTSLAFDSAGDVWVGTDGGLFGFDASGSPLGAAAGSAVEAVAVNGQAVFATYPTEGAVRRFAIAGKALGPGLTLPGAGGQPHDLVFDSSNRLWVAAGSANQVARYDQPQASPSVPAPTLVPCGFDAEGLAVSPTNSVYVLGNSTIANLSASPSATVLQDSRLVGATRMAIDSRGWFWVAGRQINQLLLVTPQASVSALSPTLSAPYEVRLDSSGNAWVSSEGNATLYEFSGS